MCKNVPMASGIRGPQLSVILPTIGPCINMLAGELCADQGQTYTCKHEKRFRGWDPCNGTRGVTR
jgi:hypothetical protein